MKKIKTTFANVLASRQAKALKRSAVLVAVIKHACIIEIIKAISKSKHERKVEVSVKVIVVVVVEVSAFFSLT